MPICIACRKVFEGVESVTCSKKCHARFVEAMAAILKPEIKVVDASTQIAYRIPTALILKKGIKAGDLKKFPLWSKPIGDDSQSSRWMIH